MGAQQVLRTARALTALVALGSSSVFAAPHAPLRLRIADMVPNAGGDRIAIIDLGPGDAPDARRTLGAALGAVGLQPLTADGADAALAGQSADKDTGAAAAALDDAAKAFGALDCKAAVTAAQQAIDRGAAREAAGLPAPELPRAWAYALLCADRAGDLDAALTATAELRALGAEHDPALTAMVPTSVWTRYPAIDATSNRAIVAVDLDAGDGATIWVDHQRVGSSPQRAFLTVGVHEVAAALDQKRGAVAVAVSDRPPTGKVAIPMTDQGGSYGAIAARVAGWRQSAHVPSADEIAALLAELGAHVAIIRRDDDAVVWTRFARAEPPHLASGGVILHVSAAPAIASLIHERVAAFDAHAPDPDQPLLTETPGDHVRRDDEQTHHTKWWVYATIGGALLVGGIVLLVHDEAPDTQHIELHYP